MLQRQTDARVRVFVVWEPILPSDFMPPTTSVLGRLTDRRVRQYWDREHVLATRMAADARPPQPEPECCNQSGVLWDIAAVYPPGAKWEARMPPATVFNGPVADMPEALAAALAPRGAS